MKINNLIEKMNEIIHSPQTLEKARCSEQFFTRDRKMPFTDVLSFFFDLRKTSLQTRLNLFSRGIHRQMISQQAFSKARNHFDHSPFETMVRTLVCEEYSGNDEAPMWNGFHVFAVDGSYLQLPKTAELAEEFGTRGAGDYCVSAGISVLYDVLGGWPIDPIITHTDMNEREECKRHLEFLSRHLPHVVERSLILLDRGYPSEDLFKTIESKGMKFLARCKSDYCKKTQKAPIGDSIVQLGGGLLVRVHKFELSSGEIETLLTNLFEVSDEELSGLYAKRWGIETAYDRLKNTVCLENFSGKTKNSVLQDFWASMVFMISISVFQKEANKKIEKKQKRKNNKYRYQVSVGDLAVTLRDQFIFEVLRKNKLLSMIKIQKIIATLAYSKSPVRPERSFPRRKDQHISFNLYRKSHL